MRKIKLLSGDALLERARELGVITDSDQPVNIPGQGTVLLRAADYEVQRRVIEAERHRREHRLWIVALLSAIASVISAVAAWTAVLKDYLSGLFL